MELFIGLYFIAITLFIIDHFNSKKNIESNPDESIQKKDEDQIITLDTPEEDNHKDSGSNDFTIINNYYIQNNVSIQKNDYTKNPDELKDHTKRIWKKLGYEVNYGETYSYKMYGQKIYTPEQVSKISSHDYKIKYSKTGLANKLLENTGSKRMAKDILVEEYDIVESEAKKLVGYKGY